MVLHTENTDLFSSANQHRQTIRDFLNPSTAERAYNYFKFILTADQITVGENENNVCLTIKICKIFGLKINKGESFSPTKLVGRGCET